MFEDITPEERLVHLVDIATYYSHQAYVQDTLDMIEAARRIDGSAAREHELQLTEQRAYWNGIWRNTLSYGRRFAPGTAGEISGFDPRLFHLGMLAVAKAYEQHLVEDLVKKLKKHMNKVDYIELTNGSALRLQDLYTDYAWNTYVGSVDTKRRFDRGGWITAAQGAVRVLERYAELDAAPVDEKRVELMVPSAIVVNYTVKIEKAQKTRDNTLKEGDIHRARRHHVRMETLREKCDELREKYGKVLRG